ncbi:MAG: Effector-associated domain 11 [Bacteroidota bacterium]|jgi:hypothetical protein
MLLKQGKMADVLAQLFNLTENKDAEAHSMVLMLSMQFNHLNTQEEKGLIDNRDAMISRNRLHYASVILIEGVG